LGWAGAEERTAHLERRKALVAERREAQQARKDRQKQVRAFSPSVECVCSSMTRNSKKM
jgi:hypothetical protein